MTARSGHSRPPTAPTIDICIGFEGRGGRAWTWIRSFLRDGQEHGRQVSYRGEALLVGDGMGGMNSPSRDAEEGSLLSGFSDLDGIGEGP